MFQNYIKIALRNLFKNRVFTLLNVFGLTIAFCVAILLAIGALDSLGKDQFHTEKDNLYQVYATVASPKGPVVAASMPVPFAPTIQKEVPGISKVTRHLEDNLIATYGDKTLQLDVSYVDAPFLEMFSFPVAEGDNNPLLEQTAVAITKKAAKLLLNTDDVVGQSIMLSIADNVKPFKIAAVLEDFTTANSLNFQILVPFENSPNFKRNQDRWNRSNHSVFLQLNDKITPQQFEVSTRDFTTKNYKSEIERLERDGLAKDANQQYMQLRLTPFVDRTFAIYNNGIIEAKRTMPYLVLTIALLILFIASVNFINMSVAQGSKRLQEIGMRKTLGASKKQLFAQLWLESVFVFTISLILGIFLGKGLLSEFQTLFRTSGSFATLLNPTIIFGLIAILISITLIAGGYPSFLLSKLGTLTALKGKMDVSSGARLRNALIIVQFGIAIVLISGTIVLNNQIDFLRQKDLGFDKNNVVSIPFNGKLDSKTVLHRLRNELRSAPEILNITAADNNLGRGRDGSAYTSLSGFDYEGRGIKTHSLIVDYDYVETLGMELITGRNFSKDRASDSLAMVINETLAKEYGKENPLDISISFNDDVRYNVIGVVKDYNFRSLKNEVEPLTMFLSSDSDFFYAFVKVDANNAVKAFDKIETAWKKINPEAAFLGTFLDENIDRTLRREKVMTTIISSGSIVAIIISCIGLFAISMLMVNQRTKEIGVRKIIGASVFGLSKLLLQDFIKLVVVAFVIATPIAWYMSFQWLQDYPYRINLNLSLFFLAGCIAVCIAMVTISFKTIQAALQNPVESLRSE